MASILLVDDDVGLVRAGKRLLERKGHEVVTASNGLEGFVAYQSGAFDLIITDYNMPVRDGRGLILALQEVGCKVPVIGVSGDVSQFEGIEYSGRLEILPKPYGRDLFDLLDDCLS